MTILKPEDLNKISHYIDGRADKDEEAWVESLFHNGEENYSLKKLLESDWNSNVPDSGKVDVDLNYLLDRVHHKIHKQDYQKKHLVLHRCARIFARAAAILIIPIIVAGGLMFQHFNSKGKVPPDQVVSSTIYAPMGARVSFNLPDGTTGMLNSGSHLTYVQPFNNNRQVTLKGEAWFDVNHDQNHVFEVDLGNSCVKVLGTRFNVMAYPDENYVEVVLENGKVNFCDKSVNQTITMAPSERVVFKGGEISKTTTLPSKFIAWTEGKMVFNNDPMAEVARRIERWYNVTVVLADKELEKYSFRGTFEDDKLEEVFRLLSMTSPIKYKITPRKLLTNGTYEKEKVTIYLKKSK